MLPTTVIVIIMMQMMILTCMDRRGEYWVYLSFSGKGKHAANKKLLELIFFFKQMKNPRYVGVIIEKEKKNKQNTCLLHKCA